MSEQTSELLAQVEDALWLGDQRAAGILLHKVLLQDFTNRQAWLLLQQLRGGGGSLEEFQRRFAQRYYPQLVHLLDQPPTPEKGEPPPTPPEPSPQLPSVQVEDAQPESPAPSPPSPEPICPRCGAELPSGAEVCPYCQIPVILPILPEPEPELAIPESQPVTPEPELTAPDPQPVTPELELQPVTHEPELAAPEPQPVTPEPELAAPEPQPVTPEPELAAPEPLFPAVPSPVPGPTQFCPVCGTELIPHAKFCNHCGASLPHSIHAAPPEAVIVPPAGEPASAQPDLLPEELDLLLKRSAALSAMPAAPEAEPQLDQPPLPAPQIAPLPGILPSVARKPYCPTCHKVFSPNDLFCDICGAPLLQMVEELPAEPQADVPPTKAEQAAPAVEAPTDASVTGAEPTLPDEEPELPIDEPPAEAQRVIPDETVTPLAAPRLRAKKRRLSRGCALALWILLLVILLVAIGVMVYLALT